MVSTPTMSRAQQFWNIPSLTVLFLPLLLIAAYSSGTSLHSGSIGAQQSVQSRVEHPSPRVVVILMALMAATGLSSFNDNGVQQHPTCRMSNTVSFEKSHITLRQIYTNA
jgi:hypothetical protein